MGRLFWKFFFAFWGTLLTAGLGAGLATHLLLGVGRGQDSLAHGPRAEFMVLTAAATLSHGGPAALERLIQDWRASDPGLETLYVVDGGGNELFGRRPPSELLGKAREAARDARRSESRRGLAQEASGPDGSPLLVFAAHGLPSSAPPDRPPQGAPRDGPPPIPWPPLAAGLLASVAFSALLAWHFVKPVRLLRRALEAVAGGRLETRIGSFMGRRRDEIADLGRDFDRMTGELQLQVEAQRRLLHDVSHELRSPLARLQAAVDLARQDPARTAASMERIERESQRLDQLVGEILTLARLEAGADKGFTDLIDLRDILAGVVEDVGFEAQASGRELDMDARAQCPLLGHAEMLHRALENILRNAVRHTPQGTTVAVRLSLRPDGRAAVSICDQGPGIAPHEAEAVFSPFYRGAARQGAPVGFGLGLAIARRAVEAHGGTLRARNLEGGGLCMDIVLPTAGLVNA